ncbi:MAG TPA: GDSL-type esterase/lipase family protein [Polyangiaceae bacterium]|nr:GDSL-type esterase/lipase family protein [Polyangiaceae bacterium]
MFILVGVLQLAACNGGGSGGDAAVGGGAQPGTTRTDGSGGSSQAGGSKGTSKATSKSSGGSESTSSEEGGGGQDSAGGTSSIGSSSSAKTSSGGTKSSSSAATGGKSGSVSTGGKSGSVSTGGKSSVAAGGKSSSGATGGTMSGDGGASRGGTSSATTTTAAGNEEWVPSWATTIQRTETSNLPPALGGNTLRQFVWPTLSGKRIRIQLSNERGNGPVEIKKVHIAMAKGTDSTASSGGIDAATDKEFLFKGAAAVTIPKGETVWSDELAFDLQEVKLTAISMQFGTTVPSDVTGHPGARTTSYVASGDAVAKDALSGGQTRERWYFIDAIEIMASPDVFAIAALGDSITDGYGVKNTFDRWTDHLTLALKKDAALAKTRTVLNFGMGANNLTSSGADQDSGLVRFERDVMKRDKIKWLILFEGVNDLTGGAQPQAVIDAYKSITTKAKAKGIKVYGSPITPLTANNPARHTANKEIRTGGFLDAVIDFNNLLTGSDTADTFLTKYGTGIPHPNIAGYTDMGNFVDLSLFK